MVAKRNAGKLAALAIIEVERGADVRIASAELNDSSEPAGFINGYIGSRSRTRLAVVPFLASVDALISASPLEEKRLCIRFVIVPQTILRSLKSFMAGRAGASRLESSHQAGCVISTVPPGLPHLFQNAKAEIDDR